MKFLKLLCAMVALFLVAVSFVSLFVFFVVCARFVIPSTSMVPTVEVGDHILVNRLAYLRSHPAHNDLIVFRSPINTNHDVLRRVIGVPGDVVFLKNTELFRNGELVREPHVIYVAGGQTPLTPTTVRESCLLVMADNRDQSRDSRLYPDYCVPLSSVKGRVMAIYWNKVNPSRIRFLN